MFVFDAPVGAAYQVVNGLAEGLGPIAGGMSAVLAIMLFTVAVRLVLLPLAVRQALGDRARARLQPQVAALRARYRKDPERQRRALVELYEKEGVSATAGCLPALAQWPFFAVMYRLFESAKVAGGRNALLAHTLLGAPLGHNVLTVVSMYGVLAPQALVCYGVLAAIAGVAWWSARRIEGDRLVRLAPYVTVVAAGFVPLAGAVYLLTTTAWTAAERALLRRDVALAA